MIPSKYCIMWIIAMFDLPVKTIEERQDYLQFRRHLLRQGFTMMQYSVYIRHCASPENTDAHIRRLQRNLPPEGEVRILIMTDAQYARMKVFVGKLRLTPEKTPTQLSLF